MDPRHAAPDIDLEHLFMCGVRHGSRLGFLVVKIVDITSATSSVRTPFDRRKNCRALPRLLRCEGRQKGAPVSFGGMTCFGQHG